ncbi:hypothetical protein SAMN05421813_104178 [Daejeonella rubra]|uniref:Uncharacterized protein n=1 Tax=Daejeonella rubra TaxID=990371 RepID=A0A1G9PL36_9SPHI|nr:hypothetical protein SAMN05421813_104178 [Daejeonella rubra]
MRKLENEEMIYNQTELHSNLNKDLSKLTTYDLLPIIYNLLLTTYHLLLYN